MSPDPLHGVTLKQIVSYLQAEYGWAGLAERVPVKCFQNNPSLGSSLKFLRRESWAREQVESEYVRLIQREDSNPLIAALKRGEELTALPAEVSQTKVHQALGWALRHPESAPPAAQRQLLEMVQDVNFWPDTEALPLLNLAVEQTADPALVRALLDRGADPNDARFWPPLLHTTDVEGQAYAAHTRAPNTAVLDLLLAHGADPELRDSRGLTALQIAEAYGLRAFINKLTPSLSI
ncbi:VF530 family DNA-binding protein [Deinococcus sp. Marseille-Q6407]|uniref:VF530 family DNA-binding protein n=1 Tax=Deinococcus sp. Marseille-Q6407 TaxID=2969223 RepID=UPI0021C13826|nr:VF530 family DNA-binding protein [Deinococcus sp. Marseille-Q6407]